MTEIEEKEDQKVMMHVEYVAYNPHDQSQTILSARKRAVARSWES